MTMTSRERLLTALSGGVPDRLPVTTHHVMPSFLRAQMNDVSSAEFFARFDLDAICWTTPHRPDTNKGEYADPAQASCEFLGSRRATSDDWRIRCEEIPGEDYPTKRYFFATPDGTLSMATQANQHTTWISEHLIKEKRDIDLIGKYATAPLCDVAAVNQTAEAWGERGIVRGHICCFDVFGQPGCWQDAACLVGIERLILEAFDDPAWVHELLGILLRRKQIYIRSLKGARYDVLELGGGDASSTVISPTYFDTFVAPYDGELIAEAHAVGQHIVYHTCGGMMPILEQIAAMNPDAMETFTPKDMGGDIDLAEAKRRVGDQVCMIGGFDQFHHLCDTSPEITRQAVRDCFASAGADGGYILSPSDHFFRADIDSLIAFSDEAQKCRYPQDTQRDKAS